jgi:hypothetical protein
VYLDGALAGSADYLAGNTGSVDNGVSFTIGGYNSAIWHFNGIIDDVRCYGLALTETEVGELFTAPTGPPRRDS